MRRERSRKHIVLVVVILVIPVLATAWWIKTNRAIDGMWFFGARTSVVDTDTIILEKFFRGPPPKSFNLK
jgi:hypothetical protein